MGRVMRSFFLSFLSACVVLACTREPAPAADESLIPSAKKNHWAWKTPVRHPPPPVKNAGWLRNPIDAFILAKLEADGIAPALPATRDQLIRRVTFDLIGLPPTPADIDVF